MISKAKFYQIPLQVACQVIKKTSQGASDRRYQMVLVSKVLRIARPELKRKHSGRDHWRLGAPHHHPMERINVEMQPLTVSCTTHMACMPKSPCVCSSYLKFSFAVESLRQHRFTCAVRFCLHKLIIENLSLTKLFSYKLKPILSWILGCVSKSSLKTF